MNEYMKYMVLPAEQAAKEKAASHPTPPRRDDGVYEHCEECGKPMFYTFGQWDRLGYAHFNSGCFLCHVCDQKAMAEMEADPYYRNIEAWTPPVEEDDYIEF